MEFLDTDFLENKEIKLVLERTAEADPVRNWVPAYHFSICDKQGNGMGHCDLRIGYNDGLYYGGHIGYAVDEGYRGHHYAAKACMLMFELAKKHGMDHLYITCNPDNWPSRKTLEYLKGELLEIAELPEDNDIELTMATQKNAFSGLTCKSRFVEMIRRYVCSFLEKCTFVCSFTEKDCYLCQDSNPFYLLRILAQIYRTGSGPYYEKLLAFQIDTKSGICYLLTSKIKTRRQIIWNVNTI